MIFPLLRLIGNNGEALWVQPSAIAAIELWFSSEWHAQCRTRIRLIGGQDAVYVREERHEVASLVASLIEQQNGGRRV